jgi:hypothetical protein
MGYVKRAECLTILSFAIRFMCLAGPVSLPGVSSS